MPLVTEFSYNLITIKTTEREPKSCKGPVKLCISWEVLEDEMGLMSYVTYIQKSTDINFQCSLDIKKRMSYVETTCLSVSPCLTYCQQLNCVSDFGEILLHVQVSWKCAQWQFMAKMTLYPYSSYLPQWVRLSTGEHHSMPLSRCGLRDSQCPDSHGVNNPLPLFSTVLILFGCNSEQMSTIIFYEITNRCGYMQSILFHC